MGKLVYKSDFITEKITDSEEATEQKGDAERKAKELDLAFKKYLHWQKLCRYRG